MERRYGFGGSAKEDMNSSGWSWGPASMVVVGQAHREQQSLSYSQVVILDRNISSRLWL